METVKLGANGPAVSRVGLGCMSMSGVYGSSDDRESVATIHAALEHGVTLIDTGDFYGMGHNELLIREALKGRKREQAVLSVKFGALRGPDGGWQGFDARPGAVRNFLAYSLRRLGTDYVDVYRPSRLDPAVPIEETVGAIGDLIAAGYVRYVGLSEVGAATIRRAHATHPVVDVQLEYSLMSRGIEATLLPAVRADGIAITAYGVLSRGLMSGRLRLESVNDMRAMRLPRFQGENLARNLRLVQALGEVAGTWGVTPAQAAIAWVCARGRDLVPLVGARTRDQLQEALGALDMQLTDELAARLEAAVPAGRVAGTRYEPQQMARLDSERAPA
jgi:aryl-alcohol dehydrogenase-like predicted oxidoreductase